MSFLFGDRTPSPFTINVLEAVRDIVQFAAAVAFADQEITAAPPRIRALREAADAETARIDRLAKAMLAAAAAADKGGDDTPTAKLTAELVDAISERQQIAARSVAAKLAEDVRAVEARAGAARTRYAAALEALLLTRDPLDATSVLRIVLVRVDEKKSAYEAALSGESDVGLAWSLHVGIPDGSPFAKPLRVEQLVDSLAILTPQKSGLIKKEIKLKKQKLDRHFVTKVVDDGEMVRVELRAEIGEAEGLDVSADLAEKLVTASRTGETDDPTVGAFAVEPEDKEALLAFARKVRDAARALPRVKLVSATFDDNAFEGTDEAAQPKLVEVVTRMVAKLAPVVRDIAARSRSDDELVLRRVLDDERREEIFLSKATLRDKLVHLVDEHRALFAPLGLDAPSEEPPAPAPPASVVRAEVPAESNRPVLEIVTRPSDRPDPENEALASTLAHIRELSETGLVDEGYRQYATLFASPTFSQCSAADQRKALDLLIRTEAPASTDEVREAYRAALGPLQALVVAQREATDYERLGLAYVVLGETSKANEVFRKALDIERTRDPESDLCGALERRLGAA